MREIKFRAWDKDGSEMFRVVNIGFRPDRVLLVSGRGGTTDTNDKDGCILMQYTGLKDKNGKEIFEGDVLLASSNDKGLPVEFMDGCFVMMGGEAGFEWIPRSDYCEVIGNIYENPELLK